jgi:hypothetical protein
MRRWEAAVAWTLFVGSRGVIVILSLLELSHHAGMVVLAPWGGYADAIRHGQLPYRDFDVLYPPGMLLLSWVLSVLPATAFHSAIVVIAFAAEVAAFALLRRVPGRGWLTPSWAYLLIGFVAPLQFIQLYGRGAFYEPLPAFFVLVSLALLRGEGRAREWGALAALAAGILLKTYPVVIAPFVLVYLAQRESGVRRLKPAVALGAMVLLPILALATLDVRGVIESYTYLGRRAVEWESTPGLVVWLAGGRDVWLWADADAFTRRLPTFGWGFFAIRGPLDHVAPAVMSALLVIGMIAGVAAALRSKLSWERLVRLSLGAVVLLMVTSRVFSPLYIAWLFPMVALVQTDGRRSSRVLWVMTAVVGTLTTLPTAFDLGVGLAAIVVLVARAVVMTGAVWMTLRPD